MPKTQTTRTRTRFSPLAAAATHIDTPRPPTGARRKGVVEYAAGDGRRAWVTHDAMPELADPELVRQLRALQPQSEPERGRLYGKEWCTGDRRRTLQVSDSGRAYRYAGSAHQGRPTLRFADVPCVARLRDAVERATGVRFNFVLLNFYNNEGGLGWHQDDEVGHVRDAPIASVSASSEPRPFDLRVKAAPEQRWRLELATGDLVVMGGACQRLLEHCVPARKLPASAWRVNATFRQFV